MERRGISQEWLKTIACVTMLLDHIGATFVPGYTLRVIGRIAFPIYCFLLAEGVAYTRNPKKYGLRLLIGALLAELPFDLLFYGELTRYHHSVMVTLLLGFVYAVTAKQIRNLGTKILLALPFAYVAERLGTDYGGWGIGMIALFCLSRELPYRMVIQSVGLAAINLAMDSIPVPVLGVGIPIQLFAVGAMLPIFLYSGRKATKNLWLQWGFYLFYPVHLTVLLLIAVVKYGYLI